MVQKLLIDCYNFNIMGLCGQGGFGGKWKVLGLYFSSAGNEIAENNADDILLDSGSTKIYQSSYQNGNWRCILDRTG